MFFVLSKSLDVLLSPLSWALILAALALAMSFRSSLRARRSSQFMMVLIIVILYVFSLEPVSNWLWHNMEKDAKSTVKPDLEYDVVVMLGGMASGESSESWGSTDYNGAVERMLRTYELLRTGKAKRALISCGTTNPEVRIAIESRVVVEQLVSWGIDRGRLVVEDQSRNTRENAVESARIIREQGWTSVLMVTSAFHMRRAAACFRAVGLRVDLMPVDYRSYDSSRFSSRKLPRVDSLEQCTQALREMFGYWTYRVRGYATEE